MPKYLTQFTYSQQSIAGMVDTPQDRRAAAEKLFTAGGGKIETMYFVFGDCDGMVIAEFPDEVSAAATLLAAGSTGAFSSFRTSQLISTGDAEAAMKAAKKVAGQFTPIAAG